MIGTDTGSGRLKASKDSEQTAIQKDNRANELHSF